MKSSKQNNPIVVGVLFSVLAGALFMIVKSLTGGEANGTVSSSNLVPAEVTSTGATPLPLPVSTRDPFFHPSLRKLPSENGGNGDVTAATTQLTSLTDAQSDPSASATDPSGLLFLKPIAPLLSLPDRMTPKIASRLAVAKKPLIALKTAAEKLSLSAPLSLPTQDPLAGLQLCAIVMGAQRQAVLIEGSGPPVPFRIGDTLHGLKIVAIQAHEIVLADAGGIYTLPLSVSAPPLPALPSPAVGQTPASGLENADMTPPPLPGTASASYAPRADKIAVKKADKTALKEEHHASRP